MESMYCSNSLVEMKSIIENKQVTTLFQPIISLEDGGILGYEALSRGPKNTIFHNPRILFEFAAKHNMLWELELLCRQKALENYKNRFDDTKLFINIDPSIIQNSRFNNGFSQKILKKHKIQPDEIIFEITENTAIKDYKGLKTILDNYADKGYKIALDDTGSAYSGLLLLAETRPHFIKIDMELIRDIDKNKFKQDLIKTFRQFSDLTNMEIIAEGIETEEELETLIQLGIQYGQGYMLQRPQDKIKPISGGVIELIRQLSERYRLIESGNVDELAIGHLAKQDSPVGITETIDTVNDIFSHECILQGIPVVKDNKVVGLVMRNKFYYQLMKRQKEGLHDKPIENVMTKLPLIVDYDAPITKVAKMAISRREETTYDYIVVTKNRQYYGVVSVLKLLEALNHCKEKSE